MPVPSRPLGDAPARDYHAKLEQFARFAEPELRALVRRLTPAPRATVLDAGCGTGFVTTLLEERVGPLGTVIACDLSRAHCDAAARNALTVQADFTHPPFAPASLDLIWAMNSINHASVPEATTRALARTLRPQGRLVLVQAGLLSDLVFAWDWRLERAVQDACYRYYRDKYGLNEFDTAAGRNLLGWIGAAGLAVESVRTTTIERTPPLPEAARLYLQESLFDGFWGEKLRPYLSPDDWDLLRALTDPGSPEYCLDRSDFHYVQTLTTVIGSR